MNYITLLILHLIGAFCVIFALGGNLVQAINKGEKKHHFHKVLGITHGVGLLLLFVVGFLLIARGGYVPIPIWIWIKIAIWGFYAIVSSLAFKKQSQSPILWFLTLLFFIFVIILAKTKPF
jgi:uncharacterized membrane protein SirB2